MDALHALKTRRSIRRFTQKQVEREKLAQIMECARFYPSAANLQPLKYVLLAEDNRVGNVLQYLRWAGYLPEFEPTQEELPTAVLLILGDKSISKAFEFDAGGAANQIMIAAHALGIASCCLGMSDKVRGQILQDLKLDSGKFHLVCAVGLGYSNQSSQAVDMDGSCKYWLDKNENFCVPKRTVDEIFLQI